MPRDKLSRPPSGMFEREARLVVGAAVALLVVSFVLALVGPILL